jgi:protein-glutamine gamma-glutamyltransferase
VARAQSGFVALDADIALRRSPYRRIYELAKLIAGGSRDPYDFAVRVQARLRRDNTYTETPRDPGRLAPLDAFMFRDHQGYCQHFSGAMALMLRMGGVPARVATGFSPGSKDGDEFVARDLDAHSWVEVYFPHIGWVTFDPTPADAPARSQIADLESPAQSPGERARRAAPSDRTSDPTEGGSAAVAKPSSSGPWGTIAIVAAALAALVALVVMVLRRRGVLGPISQLDELRRALVRSGRAPTPDVTLHRVESLLGGSPDALGYVRALRVSRYGGREERTTPRQRRALRRELAAGLGIRGRLRALWALPPRPREVLEVRKRRRARPYTG